MIKSKSIVTAIMCAVMSCTFSASAWTARELAETFDYGIEQFDWSANFNAWTGESRKVTFGIESDGTQEVLVVHNFLGAFDMYFTVNGNTVKGYGVEDEQLFFTTSGNVEDFGEFKANCILIDRAVRVDYDEHYYGSTFLGYTFYYDAQVAPGYRYWAYEPSYLLNQCQNSLYSGSRYIHTLEWTGQIVTDNYGNTMIDFGPYISHRNGENQAFNVTYYKTSGQNADQVSLASTYDSYRLTFFKKNADMSDSNTPDGYEATVYQAGENALGIANFGNIGWAWKNVIENGASYSEYDLIMGNIVDGTRFVIPQQPVMAAIDGDMRTGNLRNTNYYSFGFNPETHERQTDITGVIEPGRPEHTGGNQWVKSVEGGDRQTFAGMIIKLDPWGLTDLGSDYFTYDDAVKNTVINAPDFKYEVTFDCAIEAISVDRDKDGVYNIYEDEGGRYIKAEVDVREIQNPIFTTHYDICVVDGIHSHASTVPVGSERTVGTVVFDDATDIYVADCKVYLSEADVASSTDDPNKGIKLTFFVRANYDGAGGTDVRRAPSNGSASHLTATYHALTPLTKDTPTSIGAVEAASGNVEVRILDGAIEVRGDVERVDVFTSSGVLVSSGTPGVIGLPSGLYIVKAGTYVDKAIVK